MHSDDECDVAYSVKSINPKKKSMYFGKKWRINWQFQSVTKVQKENKPLIKTFSYKHRTKILNLLCQTWSWDKRRQERILSDKDLEEMYKTEIMFWVYGQEEQEAQQVLKKRYRSPDTGDSPTHSKRTSKSEVITHKLIEVEAIKCWTIPCL